MWRALTQPHLIEEWPMQNDFQPVVTFTITPTTPGTDPALPSL
jgi:uncharacterized protein YndB with AHSA1/START domain